MTEKNDKPKKTQPRRMVFVVPEEIANDIRAAGAAGIDRKELEARLKAKAFAALKGRVVADTAREMFDEKFPPAPTMQP